MAVAGLGASGALRGTPIVGTIKVASADNAIELQPQQLSISGSKVDGSVALAYPSEGPAIVTGSSKSTGRRFPGCSASRSTASRWPRRRPPSR